MSCLPESCSCGSQGRSQRKEDFPSCVSGLLEPGSGSYSPDPGTFNRAPGRSLRAVVSASMPAAHPPKPTHQLTTPAWKCPGTQCGRASWQLLWTANGAASPSAPHSCGRQVRGPSQWLGCQPAGAQGQLAGWQDGPTNPSSCWHQMSMQENCAQGPWGASLPGVPRHQGSRVLSFCCPSPFMSWCR